MLSYNTRFGIGITFGQFALLAGLFIFFSSCQKNESTIDNNPVFKLVNSAHSGLSFSNDIEADVSTNENLLDFDYFYNGAGVGIADINNDGLPDIFFCANQKDNKLYLNKGNLQFEDISGRSGINKNKHWSNGVTFTDINNDGWLDIYVSQGGPNPEDERVNLLLINNKDLTFTEQADIYGLNDKGISTQSSFFDFDRDGDMDCFVMNESELYGYDPVSFHRLLLENAGDVYVSYSHLYRNDNGYFKDVTSSSGITAPSFGLGLSVADLNEDGWLDIYVANDYYQPDNVYINKKNGTFSDRSQNHLHQMSFFGMGVDIADVNNDGHQDIFVLDMASKDHVRSKTLMASMDLSSFDMLVNQFGFPYQYMFNSLQINNGKGIFHNVAHMSGLAKTDWSWAAIIEDFDHDGMKDIFVTNGYRKYGTDNDFKIKVEEAKRSYNGNVPLSEKEKLYQSIPSEPLPNYMFKQTEQLKFSEVQENWGLAAPSFSNGAATGDLDGDGDLEIVINNIDEEVHLYENTSSGKIGKNFINISLESLHEEFANVEIQYADNKQMCEVRRTRGYMSSLAPMAHFGLASFDLVDKIIIRLSDGKTYIKKDVSANQSLHLSDFQLEKSSAVKNMQKSKLRPALPSALGINFKHNENDYNDFKNEVLLPYKQSTQGPCLAVEDINGDGIEDFFIGGASGQAGTIYIAEGGAYTALEIEALANDKIYEDVAALFIDLNNDGNKDLLVLSGGNEWSEDSGNYNDRIYLNINGSFQKQTESEFSRLSRIGGVVKKMDFDKDGDMDVIVGNRIIPQKYPLSAPSYLFENQNGILKDVTERAIPQLANAGIVNDIDVTDINNDGWPDLIIVGEWEKPKIFENKNGIFKKREVDILEEGMWFSVFSFDLENDGDDDFILGNIGENYKLKSSLESPLMVYAGDLDNNGTHDFVLSTKYKDVYVPVRGKECSSEQLPFITEKFATYESFASSTLVDVYGEKELDETYQKRVTSNSSVLLRNDGNFQFTAVDLPRMAQTFPLLDAVSIDLNSDGFDDLIAGGTIYNTEVETPRLDAGSGIVILNNGGKLYDTNLTDYNFYISGDLRDFEILNRGDKDKRLLVARNNEVVSIMDIFD